MATLSKSSVQQTDLGQTSAHGSASVNHWALLADRHGGADTTNDANYLHDHGFERQPVAAFDAVQCALDLRDAAG